MKRLAPIAILCAFLPAPDNTEPAAPTLTVYAAADLAVAFKEIIPLLEKASGNWMTLVLGSSVVVLLMALDRLARLRF